MFLRVHASKVYYVSVGERLHLYAEEVFDKENSLQAGAVSQMHIDA